MNLKISVALVLSTMLMACAESSLLKPTVSGYAEGIFPHSSVEEAKSRIISGCNSRGVLVQDVAGNQVFCGKTMEGMEASLAQLALGNAYSTTPERKIKFVVYQDGADAKVTAQQWVETQMPYGQVKRQELNSNKQRNDIQEFLFGLGAK